MNECLWTIYGMVLKRHAFVQPLYHWNSNNCEGESKSKDKIHLMALIEVTV